MTTVAYLILAHDLPQQVARLASLIVRGSPTSRVFIHYDAKSGSLDKGSLASVERISVVPAPLSVEWGDWSQVEVVLRCLRHIQDSVKFDWIIVLSGRDFPTQPISKFEAYLSQSATDVFMKAKPLTAAGWPEHEDVRYLYRYWKLPRFRYSYRIPLPVRVAWMRWLSGLSAKRGLVNYMGMPRGLRGRVGLRAGRTPFSSEFVLWKGSDWFNLSRRAVDYLFDFLSRRPDVLRYYRRTCSPSESLFQTVFGNSRSLQVELTDLRFILWRTEDSASPETLTCRELDAIHGSPAFFARKFDMRIDSEVLDLLEAAVESHRETPKIVAAT